MLSCNNLADFPSLEYGESLLEIEDPENVIAKSKSLSSLQ